MGGKKGAFMLRQRLMRYGGPAAILGGALYFVIFGATVLISDVFAEQVEATFFGELNSVAFVYFSG